MADIARLDADRNRTLLAVDDILFTTPVTLAANATTHALLVEGSSTGVLGSVKITDGTNTANIGASTDTNQNFLMIGGAIQTETYSTTTGGAQTAYLVSGFNSISVDIQTTLTGGGTGFQISNDNINWRNLILARSDATDFATSPGNTSAIYAGPLSGAKYFRLNLSGSGATAAGTIVFDTALTPSLITGAQQYGSWSVRSQDGSGNNITSSNSGLSVSPVDNTASGSLTGTGSVTLTTLTGTASVAVQVTGTWSGTLQFEGSIDGTNFFNVWANLVGGTGNLVKTATGNGQWYVNASGFTQFRIRCSTFTSGTIVVTLRAMTAGVTLHGVTLYAGDGNVLSESGGQLQVQVTNFAIGQFGSGDAVANNLTSSLGFSEIFTFNGSTWDRGRSIKDATNSTGTGILSTGLMAQLDDTTPSTVTENQFANLRLSGDRSLLTTTRALTPTQTSVAGVNTTTSLLAANNSRKGATFFNDSSAILYLKLGAAASTTSYSVQLASNGYYELPFGYVGAVDGIWASATGNARITELN